MKKVLLWISGFVAILWLLSFITIVGTGYIGVVTQFGKVTGREMGEGIHLKAPFPVQSVKKYDIKVQRELVDAAAASKDLQDVNSSLVINYRLEAGKVSEIHQTIGVNYKEKIILPAIEEIFKASTAKFDATQLITNRSEVKDEAHKLLLRRLEGYGIALLDISIVNFSFSPEFSKAIESKQVAQQNAERAKFNLEAARIDAESQRVQAETLSEVYLRNEAIKKWDGKLPQYLGGETVFNIPLGR